jgi:hypothetical protein
MNNQQETKSVLNYSASSVGLLSATALPPLRSGFINTHALP